MILGGRLRGKLCSPYKSDDYLVVGCGVRVYRTMRWRWAAINMYSEYQKHLGVTKK